jgi:hypothetical protein
MIRDAGGALPRRKLADKGISNKQLKQMIRGRFPVMEYAGSQLVLTKLGEKIASIGGGSGN